MSARDGHGGRPPEVGDGADGPLLAVLCTMVRFPAPRWRLVAAAYERGLDVVTVDRLLRLPPVVDTPEALQALLARAPGHRAAPPAVPPAGRPGVSVRPAPRPGPR